MNLFRLLHLLTLFWLMTGVGAVIVPTWRAWATKDLDVRAVLLSEAQQNESRWLLPGVVGVVFTGFGWAAAENMNFFGTGWLLVKMIIYAIDVFIFLPLMGVGLRRVRYLALQAQKQGESTEALRDALQDRVPVVFGTLIVITIPVLVALAVFQPF
ncbi:MAG: DUF2269 family protein [Dehalococcoidia bacterium]